MKNENPGCNRGFYLRGWLDAAPGLWNLGASGSIPDISTQPLPPSNYHRCAPRVNPNTPL